MQIMDGCWMADMVFVVSSWKEEQDMTKVDKACLSKPLDGESVRPRAMCTCPEAHEPISDQLLTE